MSIGSQREEALRIASDVEVVEVLEESKSARRPGRPVFEAMLQRIEAGEADGIIAWHPDRLARNAIDGGRIIHLLDTKELRDLKFASFQFSNDPQGMLMLSMIFGYAKYFVDALSQNVRRGMHARAKRGWRPSKAPLGYLNDRNTGTIVRDPQRFPLVRRMWDLMLTGAYTVPQVRDIVYDEGLRTDATRNSSESRLAQSAAYRILTNRFYAGTFTFGGKVYEGRHEPMVTVAEFQRVQQLIRRPGRPRRSVHKYTYTGLIRCGACGAAVSASKRTNRHGTTYTHYYCSRGTRRPRCRQPVLRVEELERQFLDFLETLTIPQRVLHVVQDTLANDARDSRERAAEEERRLSEAEAALEREATNLRRLRLRDRLTDAEFDSEQTRIHMERRVLAERRSALEQDVAVEPLLDALRLRNDAVSAFRTGDPARRRALFNLMCMNPTLTDRVLRFDARSPFSPLTKNDAQCSWYRLITVMRTLATDRERYGEFTNLIRAAA